MVCSCSWINKHQYKKIAKENLPCHRVFLLPTRALNKEIFFWLFSNEINASADTLTPPSLSPAASDCEIQERVRGCSPPSFPPKGRQCKQVQPGHLQGWHSQGQPGAAEPAASGGHPSCGSLRYCSTECSIFVMSFSCKPSHAFLCAVTSVLRLLKYCL